MTIKQSLVVADAGVLIHLDELGALDVLSDYDVVYVPNAVWLEVEQHRNQALQNKSVNLIRWSSEPYSVKVNAMSTLFTLHHGECEALTLCLNHAINTLLTDDTAARLAAKNLSINAHGSLGLLVRAVRQKLRTPVEVVELLMAIPQKTSLHIRPKLLHDVIAQVQAEWNT
ncbi:MAG: DNA-binding protein [Methylococcales bacterium]|nr:DNA-binding protein [Methylococcales bacterium]